MEITLVSGLVGQIRPLKGAELKAVATPAALRNGDSALIMLRSCLTEVVDPGPYPWLEAGGKVDWDRVLAGDQFDALMRIRALTFGDEYDCRIHCTKCKESYEWTIPLLELPRRELSEDTRTALRGHEGKGGPSFTCTAAGGREVSYHLAYGADLKMNAKRRKQQGGTWSHIDAILGRLVQIEGVGHIDSARAKLTAALEDMYWPDVMALLRDMDAGDCGIDTLVETKCTFCGYEQENELPFDADFFAPKKLRRPSGGKTTETTT